MKNVDKFVEYRAALQNVMKNMAVYTKVPTYLLRLSISDINVFETCCNTAYDSVTGELLWNEINIDLKTLRFLGSEFIYSLIGHELGHAEARYLKLGLSNKDEEKYADIRAMEILYNGGLDPRMCIEELHLWSKEYGYDSVGDGEHPTGRERIDNLENYLKKNSWLIKSFL